jgi:hypothetical protein
MARLLTLPLLSACLSLALLCGSVRASDEERLIGWKGETYRGGDDAVRWVLFCTCRQQSRRAPRSDFYSAALSRTGMLE